MVRYQLATPRKPTRRRRSRITVRNPTITIPFADYSSVIVCGASNSGKTSFVVKCIKNLHKMYITPPVSVHYFYGVHQQLFDDLAKENNTVHFREGAPTQEDIAKISRDGKCHAIVLDDLMDVVANNEYLCRLFTQGCHHKKLCVFFLTQNLFQTAKYNQTISRNAHYFVFTKSPRNLCSLINLTKQVFPGKSKAIEEAYKDVSRSQDRIFVLDLHPSSDDRFRMRSAIFDDATLVYMPI